MSVRNFDLSDREDNALGQYLQILRPAPAPRLAAGRERVLAEAARLEERHARWRRLFADMAPSFSFALASVVVLSLLVLTAVFAWNSSSAGGGFFGLFSTPTVAYTTAPLREASATLNSAPVELNEATPQHTEASVRRLGAGTSTLTTTPAPIPTPEPTRTLLGTAQPESL